jgi:transposase
MEAEMGTSDCSDEFKRDAVQQIRVRGYPVREISRRLGLSSHSLYKWLGLFAEPEPKLSGIDHEAENRSLQWKLAGVTEERDIPKMGEPWIATGSRAMAQGHPRGSAARHPLGRSTS